MTCPSNPPPPSGYRVWRGPVPQPLIDWAIGIRDRIRSLQFGNIQSLDFNGSIILARVDHHSWTYRNGQLVTGICIPGVTLYEPIPGTGAPPLAEIGDPLATPDPELALFSADTAPPEQTDWRLVALTAFVTAATVGLFFLALQHAGRKDA